jgi:hypothetical protein
VGQFSFSTSVAQLASGANPVGLVAADFNKDGRPDLASANFDGASVSVFLNRYEAR